MQRILLNLLDFIFPIQCSFCGKFDFFASKLSICKNCFSEKKSKVTTPLFPKCDICDSHLVLDTCEYCNSRNIFFSKLYSIRIKGDLEKEIIQKIKFGNAPYLSNIFRIGLRRLIPRIRKGEYTNIVNIPSSKNTIRKRPISVCYPIVNFLKKSLRIKTINPLYKKSKELQSGKTFRDRFIHAQNAFEIKKEFIHSLGGN